MASSRLCSPRWPRAPSKHSHPDTVASSVMKHTKSQHSVSFLVGAPGSFCHSVRGQCHFLIANSAGVREQLLPSCSAHSFQCAGEATLGEQVLPSCSHGRFDRMDSKLLCPKPGWLLSSWPFLEDTCATHWSGRRPVDSITLENAGLSEQLLKEPGWWWQLPVILDKAGQRFQSSGSEAHGPRILTSSLARQLWSPLRSPWPISCCFLFNIYVYILKSSKTLKMRD